MDGDLGNGRIPNEQNERMELGFGGSPNVRREWGVGMEDCHRWFKVVNVSICAIVGCFRFTRNSRESISKVFRGLRGAFHGTRPSVCSLGHVDALGASLCILCNFVLIDCTVPVRRSMRERRCWYFN